tara:strand:+ start:5357 stop:5614 length:258 start_codon:yes stop_codon:yes gene_type:complete
MNSLEEYNSLKKKLDGVTEDIARQKGALDHVKKELQTEFNVKDLKEAKALLAKMKRTNKKDQEKHNQQLAEFQERFGDVLERGDA